MKRYLKQFLSDPRVIEIPAIAWQPILRGIILNTRPQKSAAAYSKIWTDRGSPLADITASQAEAIAAEMGGESGVDIVVDYAMRYGQPSIEKRLGELTEKGCDRILIAPMYPQYCAATTATVSPSRARPGWWRQARIPSMGVRSSTGAAPVRSMSMATRFPSPPCRMR